MNARRIAQCVLVCAALIGAGALPPARVLAGTDLDQSNAGSHGQAAGLIQTVRQATERFKDVAVAEAEGYSLMFGCVSGPDSGAMGLHYVNLPLVVESLIVLGPLK